MNNKLFSAAADLKSAPKEVQQAIKDHEKNVQRLEKAKEQMKAWLVENQLAREEFDITEKKLEGALNSWKINAVAKPEEKVK